MEKTNQTRPYTESLAMDSCKGQTGLIHEDKNQRGMGSGEGAVAEKQQTFCVPDQQG